MTDDDEDWPTIPWSNPRRVWYEARHAAVMAGYWVRPYNDLLDRRIWRWQRRPLCQWQGGRPWEWP